MSSIRKEIHLTERNVRLFERYFPKTSLSWALDLLLEKFIEQYDRTPEEYIEEAAKSLKEEIGS